MTNNKTVGQLQPVRKTKPRGKANAVGIFFDVWNFRKSYRKKFPQKIPKIPTTIQKFLNITNYICPWEKSKHPKNRKKI